MCGEVWGVGVGVGGSVTVVVTDTLTAWQWWSHELSSGLKDAGRM